MSTRPKVLLVDDHGPTLEATAMAMEDGYTVLRAGPDRPVPKAVEMWTSQSDVNIALVDLRMPVNGTPPSVEAGFRLLSDLKSLRPNSTVLIHSAYKNREHEARARREGAAGFFQKDWDRDTLLRELLAVVRLKLSPDAVRRLESDTSARLQFECGGFVYPLRVCLTEDVLSRVGQRLLLERAVDEGVVKRAIHFEFQRIDRAPPHEITAADEEKWAFLTEIIDEEAYCLANPPPVSMVGTLARADLRVVEVRWYGGGEEMFDSLDMPPDVLTKSVGSTVHVVLQRWPDGRRRVISSRISPPLRRDDVVWEESADGIAGFEETPVGSWPKHG